MKIQFSWKLEVNIKQRGRVAYIQLSILSAVRNVCDRLILRKLKKFREKILLKISIQKCALCVRHLVNKLYQIELSWVLARRCAIVYFALFGIITKEK